MDRASITKAKEKAVALVKALKAAESGRKLKASEQAILDWALDDGSKKLTATLDGWAVALGRERRTLERVLTRGGIKVQPGMKFTAQEIYVGIVGDEQAERVRNLKSDADRKEREEKEALGTLFPMAELEGWLSQHYVIPMASIFADMPAAIDTRCNPQDPKVARQAIEAYIEATVKPTLKLGLEKPKLEKQ